MLSSRGFFVSSLFNIPQRQQALEFRNSPEQWPYRSYRQDLRLKLRASGCAGKRNDITNICDTGHEHQHALETEAEAGMGHGPITAEIEIPFIILWVHFVAAHARFQDLQAFLALAPSDNLANSRHQQVHRRHRFVVVVQPHVERFDLLWVIKDSDRTFEMLLAQPALVLRLQIQTVLHRELELLCALPQQLNRLGVSDSLKWPIDYEIEP